MRHAHRLFRADRILLAGLVLLTPGAAGLNAQEKIITLPADAPKSAAPLVVPAALSLDECVALAFERQPALAAARASLAAAADGQHALANLPLFARCITRELPYRQQQACLGVTIQSAMVAQAEWEARYAVTRNYFTVIYARTQHKLLTDVITEVNKGRKRARQLLDSGAPDVKVTKIDIDLFDINIDLLRAREAEATVGEQKALAALREAMGVGLDFALEVAPGSLPGVADGLDRDALIKLALANRGEITQVSSAKQVTELEIAAQDRKRHGLKVGTFAGGSDIHAQPIPQGVANGEYRPGGLGLDYPPMLVGRREDRVARASDLSARAGAVVDKTFNLVALETENSYLKWLEARNKLTLYTGALPRTKDVEKRSWERLDQGNATGAEYIQAATLKDQIQAQYNEQLYLHALALAALERITAGGFRIYPTKQP